MNTALNQYDPLVSEYENAEHEAQHTAWIQARATQSLADTRPRTPHAQVMAEMNAVVTKMLERERAQQAA